MLDKKIIVTGAGGALGVEVVQKVLTRGAVVFALDLSLSSELQELCLRHKGILTYIQVDLCDKSSLKEAVDQIGEFEAVINLAGGFEMGASTYDGSAAMDRMFKLNVDTLLNVLHYTVPVLLKRKSGNIVNVGALGALKGTGGMSAYCSAKATVMKITESLSDELKVHNINVNAVLPSIINTPQNRKAMPESDFSLWVQPDELSNVICFLASDSCSAIHGALIPVAGRV